MIEENKHADRRKDEWTRREMKFVAVLNDERQMLIARRQELDFAKHEYTNNPNDQKKEIYEKALAKFNEQSETVWIYILLKISFHFLWNTEVPQWGLLSERIS